MTRDEALQQALAALEFVAMHLEYRDGLRHRMDLFTQDERNKVTDAIEAIRSAQAS